MGVEDGGAAGRVEGLSLETASSACFRVLLGAVSSPLCACPPLA